MPKEFALLRRVNVDTYLNMTRERGFLAPTKREINSDSSIVAKKGPIPHHYSIEDRNDDQSSTLTSSSMISCDLVDSLIDLATRVGETMQADTFIRLSSSVKTATLGRW